MSTTQFDFGPTVPSEQEEIDEAETERQIDLWHDGYFMHRDGKPRPTDCQYTADGWDHRANEIQTVVVMPERPEGYYHMPLGTFD